ncbi:hypothetical protein AVEN_275448-1 [Araneus ventricosus]|uniref:Uncharacterized protein n=1 Tax=Araneus ventricosus TaxID=182803 RepID=A0A4Y2IVK2_ARAVE|nr:hypothetical protein AVEN_275448-1 [Araneus ventricosus]
MNVELNCYLSSLSYLTPFFILPAHSEWVALAYWFDFGIGGWRVPGLKPDSAEDLPSMWAWCTLNSTSRVNCPLAGLVRKPALGVLAQLGPVQWLQRS